MATDHLSRIACFEGPSLQNMRVAVSMLDELALAPVATPPTELNHSSIYIYGAGQLGKLANAYFKHEKMEVAGILDRNAAHLSNSEAAGQPNILHPSQVPIKERARSVLVLCISNQPIDILALELEAAGWARVVHFYDYTECRNSTYPINNGWYSGSISSCRENILEILSRFSSWQSRADYFRFLAWRQSRIEPRVSGLITEEKYLIKAFKDRLIKSENIIDIGAHHGLSAIAIAKACNSRATRITAIEPDPQNFKKLKCAISSEPTTQEISIEFVNVAVSSLEGRQAFFATGGYESRLCPNGNIFVPCVTLDQLGTKPTFLKIHTEGNELDIVKTGLQTINEHRPKIALTTYHNASGVYETYQSLFELVENYDWEFRMHNYCGCGAVLYGLPR